MQRVRSLAGTMMMAAGLLLAAEAPAQQVDPNRVFDFSLEVDGQIMSGRVLEGRSLRVVLRQTDEFELVPVLAPGTSNRVLVAVYRATVNQADTRRLVERLDLSVGVPASLRSGAIRVVVDAVGRLTAARTRPGQAGAPATLAAFTLQSDYCCLCCGGTCMCACGVKTENCGHCCVGDCCKLIEPTSSEHAIPEILTQSRRFAVFSRGTCTQGSLFDRPRTPAPAAVRSSLAIR